MAGEPVTRSVPVGRASHRWWTPVAAGSGLPPLKATSLPAWP